MAHLTARSPYERLVDRLNRFPQGAPPSDLLYAILRMLFSEEEASLVALLPIRPFTVRRAARAWRRPEAETRVTLERLADRGILLDVESSGRVLYVLPPPMAGFFEFSMMRVRHDLDQRVLAELFYQYLNVEEEFIKALFTVGETQLGRVFVHEPALEPEHELHVLDYERASHAIRTASHRAVGICYCRHKMEHLGRACSAPLGICMTLNATASSLTRHGIARQAEVSEMLDLLQRARDLRLVQFGENVQRRVSFICNCCGCCCEALIAARRFSLLHPVHTTNFIPETDESVCNGCGKCTDACPVEAMALVSTNQPSQKARRKAKLDPDRCLGCGVCVRVCPNGGIHLKSRPERVITPLDSTHRAVAMAVERGKLQNLIFDNHALWNHRAMAAILGAILRLPPVSRALASRQVKSRYLESLIARARA